MAKRAHVSVTTASAALRGAAGVNEETRRHVIAVATALGYRADAGAAALRSGRGGMIGMIMDASAFGGSPGDPELFWPRLLNGFTAALTADGFGVAVVASTDLSPLTQTPLKALVIQSAVVEELVGMLPFGLPLIAAGCDEPAAVAHVSHDYAAIAAECVGHLKSEGATGLGFLLSPSDPPLFHQLADQFTAAAARSGLRMLPVSSVPAAIIAVENSEIDTLIAGGQADAARLLTKFAEAGIDVPNDVLLLTLSEGDVERNLVPSVSTLSFQGAACGRAIAEVVLSGLATNDFPSIVLPHQLDQRQSTTRLH